MIKEILVLFLTIFLNCLPNKDSKNNYMSDSGFCKKNDNYDKCRSNFSDVALLILLSNSLNTADIQIKNSSTHSSLIFTFKDQNINLATSEISKVTTIYYDPLGQYKITTETGTIINNSSFNFRGNFNDGTIIRTDGTLVNYFDLRKGNCNVFDVGQGKIIQSVCLTPTNP